MSAMSEVSGLLLQLWPLLLGNILEWYEFSVYGYMSKVLAANFFKGSEVGLWLGYAASFVSRPLGGLIMGAAADRYGRRPVTIVALVGMVLATACQGLLPVVTPVCAETWRGSSIGLYILITARLFQGIFVGGEESGVGTYLAEEAPMKRKGLATSLYFATAFFAFLITSGLVALLYSWLGLETMNCWGWRVPFLVVLPIGAIALCGRMRVPETAAFTRQQQQQRERRSSDRQVAAHACAVVLGCVAAGAFSALFYTSNVWCIGYLKAQGMPAEQASWLAMANNAFLVALTPVFGMVSDRVGVGSMAVIGFLWTTIAGVPVFALLQAYSTNWLVVLACLSLGFGIPIAILSSSSLLFCAELFPTEFRTLGIGLTHNLAMSLVGGSAPLAAQAFIRCVSVGPGLYISAFGLLSTLTLWVALRMRARGQLQMTHLRPEPYIFHMFRGEDADSKARDSKVSADQETGSNTESLDGVASDA